MAERIELEPGILVSWDKYLGWYWHCSCEPVAHCYDDQSLCALDASAHYRAAHNIGAALPIDDSAGGGEDGGPGGGQRQQ